MCTGGSSVLEAERHRPSNLITGSTAHSQPGSVVWWLLARRSDDATLVSVRVRGKSSYSIVLLFDFIKGYQADCVAELMKCCESDRYREKKYR